MVCPAVGLFQLQVLKEAFTDSIVEGISFFRKGLYYIQGIQKPAECKGGILGPAVRVERVPSCFHKPFGKLLWQDRHPLGGTDAMRSLFLKTDRSQSIDNTIFHRSSDRWCHWSGRDWGHFEKTAAADGWCIPRCLQGGRKFWFSGWHLGQLHAVHQAVHSSDTNVNAIVTLKDVLDFISSQTFVVIGVDM